MCRPGLWEKSPGVWGPWAGPSETRISFNAAELQEQGRVTSPSPESGASAVIRYIDTQDAFDELMSEIAGEPLLAVDTEAARFHR